MSSQLPNGLWSDFQPFEDARVKANANFNQLDWSQWKCVIAQLADAGDLPGSPAVGDSYLVSDTQIYVWYNSQWNIFTPPCGWMFYDQTLNEFFWNVGGVTTNLSDFFAGVFNFIVGPNSSVVGNIPIFDNTTGNSVEDSGINFADILTNITITEWGATAWTPTGSWVANTTYTGIYRRVADEFQARVDVTATANIGSQGDLVINLPPSHTIDTTKLVGILTLNAVGYGTGNNDSSNDDFDLVVRYLTTTSVSIHFKNFPAAMVEVQTVDENSPITWSTDDSVTIYFQVPIVEYA